MNTTTCEHCRCLIYEVIGLRSICSTCSIKRQHDTEHDYVLVAMFDATEAERGTTAATFFSTMRDRLDQAEATLAKLREIVPERAAGWCYDCETVVAVYHYGGTGNPACAKCKGTKTDELSECVEQYIAHLHSILYPKENGNG